MLRTRIIGVRREKKIIMDVLTRSGCFEIAPTRDVKHESLPHSTSHLSKVVARQAKVSFAIEYLDKINDEAKERNKALAKTVTDKLDLFDEFNSKTPSARVELGYDEYYDITAREYELMAIVDDIEKTSFERTSIKSEINKLNIFNRNLAPYKDCDLKFSRQGDTKSASIMLALGTVGSKVDGFKDLTSYIQHYNTVDGDLIGIICPIENKQKLQEKLGIHGYTLCPYDYDKMAKDIIEQNNLAIKKLQHKDEIKIKHTLLYSKYYDDFKTLYDVQGLDIEKSTAELDFVKTKNTFILEGWVAESAYEAIESKLKEKTEMIVITSSKPTENDTPPTLVKNNAVVRPFEAITNNYSAPAYGELDPNSAMSIFFFIFFGIMLGDAGYGLALSIACFVGLKFLKLDTGMKQMLLLFGICGFSGIIFGLIFGGIFAIDSVVPIWFNPLDEPIMMLIFSLALGAVHLLVGYSIKMVKKMRAGHPIDGLFDAIFMYLLFGGIALLAIPMALETTLPLATIGAVLLILSIIGMVLTNGRNAPTIGGKISGGLGSLYGLINIFSDVLSYSRLFGLALSSAAIGMAFNLIGQMLFAIPVVGYVIGGIVLVVLHAFNFALALLSAYVHNMRLQYLEFYGKFYEGDGRLFAPLGENTTYVRFVEK